MAHIALTDEQVSALISERKQIPQGLCPVKAMTEKQGHRRKDFDVESNSDNRFQIRLRQLCANPLDFSVILLYQLPGLYVWFRLRRYNGLHRGGHTNNLEKQVLPGSCFHIHTATERYQQLGLRADTYAQVDARFYDLESAIQCLLTDCGFRSPMEESPLFTGQMI